MDGFTVCSMGGVPKQLPMSLWGTIWELLLLCAGLGMLGFFLTRRSLLAYADWKSCPLAYRIRRGMGIVSLRNFLLLSMTYDLQRYELETEIPINVFRKSDYYIKCCFTCQYSDYSPYGSDDYGLMLRFCRHKIICCH